MTETIAKIPTTFRAEDGRRYLVRVLGTKRADHTWSGSLEFEELGTGRKIRTGQETSQPNRDALSYWATGLEYIYLEGALVRALDTPNSS